MNNVTTYSLADDFIKELSSFIEDNFIKYGKDLSKLAVVFGGVRPRLFLQKELSLRIKKPFFPPAFFSIDEFVETLVSKSGPYALISDLEACFTIYRLAQKQAPDVLEGRRSFAQFLPWAREILAFIEQLDLEAVEAKPLEDIQHHAAIGYDVPESINKLLTRIVALRVAFHKVLIEKKSYTRGFMYLLAAGRIAKESLGEFENILFCNFFYLHKTEEAIVGSLYERKKALLFFQGDEREWSVLARTSKSLGCQIRPKINKEPDREISIHAGFDLHSQVCYVREILKGIKDPGKTVIVLPDPESIIPLLSESAACMGGPFNVSMGYPVKRSSMYSLFESLFVAQETKKGEAYYAKDYLRLLSHPLIKNISFTKDASVTRILVHKIEEVLSGTDSSSLGGSLFVRLDDIYKEELLYEAALDTMKRMDVEVTASDLKAVLRSLHELLFTNWEAIGDIEDFSLCLEEFLDVLLDKSFLDKYPLNLKVAEKIYKIAEEFKNASFKKEIFKKEDIFKVFKDKLETEMVSFCGSPLAGLQVLGLFETRSLSFENVIVLDANESVLPKLKIHEPLIPRDVALSLGLNRLEKEEEIQRYQFSRLLSSARSVHLFYQENENKEKSRFIEELMWKKQKAMGSLEAFTVPAAGFTVKVAPKEIEIHKRPHMISFLQEYRYSASSINTYLHCPLRFYYQYVLALEENESLDEPEASDVGTFIHNILEEGFKKFTGKRPSVDVKFREYFLEMFESRFDKEFRRKTKSDAFLIKEVMDLRLSRFLDHESKQDIKRLECVEKVYEDKILLDGRAFKFKAKIDRIDTLPDDSLLIIDYKTGSSDIMPASAGRVEAVGFSREALKNTVKSFQLPVYYCLVKQEHKGEKINACLYNIRDLGKNLFFRNEEGIDQREEIMVVYLKALGHLCAQILDPKVHFKADQEDSRYCANCPFFYLCR
ncbi:MAG: PD-(D/E)XK nuclease family protein [Candidatus Omnitrophica bacterium]|nr:PD-(D/E)XK nuclease family protein [Candidatus Omnitrophota bacterium]